VAAARATEGKAAASWVKAAVLSQVYTVLRLLDLTLVPSLDEILLSFVLGQELELLGVDGAAALLADILNSVLVLHAELDEGDGDECGGSAQSSHAVNPHTRVRVVLKLLVYK